MKDYLDTTVKRLLTSLLVGLILTGLSWFVVNANLKVETGGRTVNANVAAHFATCHGESINVNAPAITYKDRGFPVAFIYQQSIPLCGGDRLTVHRTETVTETNWTMAAINLLTYSALAFVLSVKSAKTESGSVTIKDQEA